MGRLSVSSHGLLVVSLYNHSTAEALDPNSTCEQCGADFKLWTLRRAGHAIVVGRWALRFGRSEFPSPESVGW